MKDFFFISQIDNFKSVKKQVLRDIELTGRYSFCDRSQQIYNTDWHLPRDFPRPYIENIVHVLDTHCKKVGDWIGSNVSVQSDSIWYQQYMSNDRHKMHTHGSCNFSNVMFIELPDKEIATEFYFNGENFSVDVKEGDILTFPGFIPHISPENKTDNRKTVIVFNTNIVLG